MRSRVRDVLFVSLYGVSEKFSVRMLFVAVFCISRGYIIASAGEMSFSVTNRKEVTELGIIDRLFGRTAHSDVSQLAGHYADVRRWEEIYNGGGDWRITRKGGLNGGSRRVASLGAARAVCAELSRLCFTEGSSVCSADPESEAYIRSVLQDNRFTERFPAFLESVFALGGGVVKVFWDDGVKLDFVTADCFVPTEWDGRHISGGAFASRITREGKNYILAETQNLDSKALTIENRLIDENGAPKKLSEVMPSLSEKSVIRGLEKPLFVYFGTGSAGSDECRLLGRSVYAGAVDTLKSLDLVFDSLGREFILGKKRIIVPYYAVRGEYDENGDIRKYFDVNDEVFQAMSVSDSEELKISDNTTQLRVTEHTEALSALLDLLCMQVGLSEGALSYKDGTIKTAAEVVSRNSRTYRTQAFYRSIISEGLSRVTELICILGKMGGKLSDGASEKATLMFADGAAEDDASRIEKALRLYNAGVISRTRAISQIYDISLEEAESMERMDFNGKQ